MMQVVVAKEAVGNLGGLVRQLSLDQFENESRRMVPVQNDMSYSAKKFQRQKSPQGLHKKVRVAIYPRIKVGGAGGMCWELIVTTSIAHSSTP